MRPGFNPGLFYCALPWSNPAIPFVAAVFPEAALAGAELGVAVDRLDFHDVFRHLVAELAFDAEAERRAMGDRKSLAVQLIGEDRLRVEGILEAVAFVIAAAVV